MTDDKQREALSAAEALAHLYVWDTIVSILEGSATPARQDEKSSRAVDRVIAIAKNETQRCLRIHEKHMAAMRYRDEKEEEDRNAPQQMCVKCGHPTMHIGNVCYACSHAEKEGKV